MRGPGGLGHPQLLSEWEFLLEPNLPEKTSIWPVILILQGKV